MLVGRDEIINSLANQSVRRHLVTIVGPAGVGKSVLASAIAERTASRYANGTVLVDLACVDDQRLLELTLASALGISPSTADPTGSLVAYLSSMELRLVIDNCEHLLGPLAYIAEEIVRCAPNIDVLVTSREPLRCSGEWLYRLPPLELPAAIPPLSVDQALQSAAVRLFVQSAAKSLSGFRLSEANLAAVVSICRQLDGIPLAIQLVAARVRNFSADELARAVRRQPLLLARGWRSANVTHHASLQAALDWTYTRLTGEEQLVFRRLAVFRGPFSLPLALEIAAVSLQERAWLPQALLCLAEKSLVSFGLTNPQTPYRLLHLTRSYALEKLVAAGELDTLQRRHASHYASVLSEAAHHGAPLSHEEWLDRYRYTFDDLRAAMEWAFSAGGDQNIAARLTVAAVPIIFQLCLAAEFQRWIDIALGVFAASDTHSLIPQAQLCLTSCVLYFHFGYSQETVLLESAQRAVDSADLSGDELLRVMARVNQIVCDLQTGNPPAAVARLAQLAELVARASEPIAGALFDRVSAQVHHYNGDFAKARTHARRALHFARQPVAVPMIYSAYSLDHRISMRVILACSAWLEGRADEAVQIANECVELARLDRPFALGQVLSLCACPIAFWRGDLPAARSFTAELLQCARRFGLDASGEFSRCYRLVLGRLEGEDTDLVGPAHPANTLQFDHLATLSDQWLNGATLARAEQGLTGWCTAEILRRHGEMLLQKGETGAFHAADCRFRQALGIARAQGAHAWEVRICMSLARLHRQAAQHGQSAQYTAALQELATAHGRLQQGHDDADAIQARRLLEGQTDELVLIRA
jgi:predicted ATPase